MIKSLIKKYKLNKEREKQFKKNIEIYNKKHSNYQDRIENEFINNGVANIPCNVNDMDDILSNYSVSGYESLNGDFMDYINAFSDIIPLQYPMVLTITGKQFTAKEQETIRNTIDADLSYAFVRAEKDHSNFIKMIFLFVVGVILTGIMIVDLDWLPEIHSELLYIVYWFFGDSFLDYMLNERGEIKSQKMKLARLASIKVEFSAENRVE